METIRKDLRTPWYWLTLLANWVLVPFAWLTYWGGVYPFISVRFL